MSRIDEDQQELAESIVKRGKAGTEAEEIIRICARVSGRVQGVGFRYFVRAHADQNGLTGWVRNRTDGSVELEAQGPVSGVNRLLVALNQGPPLAMVTRLIENRTEPVDWEENFRIRH